MRAPWTVVTLSFAVGFPCIGCAQPAGSGASHKSQDPQILAYRARSAVLDRVFPIDPDSMRRWRVAVQIVPQGTHFEALPVEEQLAFERHYDGSVHLSAARASGTSVFDQLVALYRLHPNLSPQDAAGCVHVERRSLGTADLPQLEGWAEELEEVRIPALVQADIYVEGGVSYTIWTLGARPSKGGPPTSQGPNWLSLSITGPGPKSEKQPNDLVRLVERARRVVWASNDGVKDRR